MEFFKNICKGAVIGIANVIPGVSGGTMAIVMGIYDKLIHCLTHFLSDLKKNIMLLIPIILGVLLAIVGGSFGLEYLFGKYPLPTNLFFIGLILGGLPAITKKVKGNKIRVGYIICFIIFFVIVTGMAAFGNTEGSAADLSFNFVNVLKLFGVGALSSAAMVIPGVSGSMMLLLIGYYHPVLEAINNFMHALTSGDMQGVIHGFGILFPFGVGVLIGIFAIAKLIEIIFKKFPMYAYWAIIGLIIASPFAIVLMNLAAFSVINAILVIVSVLTFASGFIIAMKLGE